MIKANNLCIFCKMEKNEFCAVIKHLHMKGLTPKEMKAELDNVLAHLHQRLRLYTIE